jgi:hypothetical protein
MTTAFDRFLASEEAVATTDQIGMEFPSMDALKKYLHLHPKADPKNHSVKKDDKGEGGKGEETKLPPKIKKRQEDAEAFMNAWEKAEEFAGHKLPKPEKLKELGKKIDEEEKTGKPRSDEEAAKDNKEMWSILDKEVGDEVDKQDKEFVWSEDALKHMPKAPEYAGLTAAANRRVMARRIVARFKGR